jgi:hypothetical protein
MKLLHLLLTFCACVGSASAQKMETPGGEAPGPWLLGTIGVGRQPDKSMTTTALKGLAFKLGADGEAAVAYDLDLCRIAGAWSGKFTTPMNLMSRGEYPTAMGEVAFTTAAVAGFQMSAGTAAEPAVWGSGAIRGRSRLGRCRVERHASKVSTSAAMTGCWCGRSAGLKCSSSPALRDRKASIGSAARSHFRR